VINDNICFYISKYSGNIRHLNLALCHQITDRGVR
jgi:hypothetical protein